MAKIGDAGFPVLTLSEAIGIVEDIKEENIQTVEALAKHLGHKSSNSGAFKAKLAALNKYFGLMDQDNIDIQLTKRGQNIAYEIAPGDRERAVREAARSVDLIQELYGQLGADFNRHDFLPRLKEITGASPEEIESKGSKVQKVYEDALRYIGGEDSTNSDAGNAGTPEQPHGGPNDGLETPTASRESSPAPDQADDYYVFKTGHNVIRLEKDIMLLEDARDMIDVWMTSLRRRQGEDVAPSKSTENS